MEVKAGMMQKWFILLLATLTLCTVVSATGVLFVKATDETFCPQQPCHTLEHYAQSWQLYLTSNTVVQFLPGEHVLEGDWNKLAVHNVSNLTLIGSDSVILDSLPLGIPLATSRISCRRGDTFFYFYDVTGLLVTKLTFSECGGGKATVFLYKVSDLVVDSVTIQNSTGTGLIGINLQRSLIHHSAFVFNQATSDLYCSGNIMLMYIKHSNMNETFTLNMTSSWILFGNSTTKTGCVGGLSLSVDQSCYNMKVHIHNTTLKANVGGNMFLGLIGFANGIVIIVDSHFEGGYALEFGGGIFMYTRDNALQVSQHVQTNLMYINNTDFVGNSAEFGGAMVSFISAGTELYINGSKFQNNVAHHGGHISICFHTCANISITINNSVYADGKATSGRGGGVEVLSSLHSESQCAKANHVYIGSTQFVRNRANFSGGAVSLWGCTGTELYIDESEFYNNTTPLYGGHIALHLSSNCIHFIVVNNSHFESGKAQTGGGISVFVGGSCISVNSTIHKSVYILNSKVYKNVAHVGGGLTVQFNHTCFAIEVLIHNVSISRNAGTNDTGGNIFVSNLCTAANSITISRSTVEFGTSPVGGGMAFLTGAFPGCPASMINLKPTSVKIVDSTIRYNTARKRGGGLYISLGSFEYSCCGAQVDITNVTFFNNKANTVSYGVNETETSTTGGNICIDDGAGQWFNNSVRIQNSLIEGGVAQMGGGIYVNIVIYCQQSIEIIISNARFICNQTTKGTLGALLMVVEIPNIYNMTLYSMTTTTYFNKLTITDTTFDGPCGNSSNVNIQGMGAIAPYLPTQYNVVFINVSFKGHSTDHSSPPTIHSQQLFGDHIILNPTHTAAVALYTIQPLVMLSFIPNATFIDCEFFESAVDSGLAAEGTNVFFGGNITFRDNRAIYGGGLTLLDNSIMYLTPNTRITFSHNHATYAGGAIYVQSDGYSNSPGSLNCFYQFDGINQDISDLNIQITFENNTAYFAGSALYGGFVDFCSITVSEENNNDFDSIFKVQNTDNDPTAISSDPYRVCPCNDSRPVCGKLCNASNPHCSSNLVWPMYTYPGALFQIQAVVVGQKDGIVPGVVRAALRNTSAVLGDLQYSQAAGKSCTTLNYTVFSSQTEETITLVTETIPNSLNLKGLIINVTLLNCPWGFMLRDSQPKCDCVDKLQEHHIYQCNITTQTINRPPPLWIGYYHSGNNSEHSVEGVLVHDNCPFDYCKLEQLSIQLNNSDKQCAFNHSGILCGACQQGLSLALGTSRCLKCSNKYLMLLFAFTAAGLALVFLLTLTNMTVSEGTINGLIFYANIIHINRAIFFPNESIGINKIILDILSTFISWINLDLGIETCFYNGMDMYTKAWLQFLFPIYIWTIVGGMIVSSHYSTAAAKLFRRHAVKVLATLFLLSFAKLQRTIITALSFIFLTYPDGTKTVWLYDSNIEYLRGKHIPLSIAAYLALLFLLIPYTFVLFFIQCLPKLNCQIFFWVKKLKPLFDAYTGPYKDRYRFWTGFLLFVRTILFLIFTFGNPALNLAAISVTSTCLAFTPSVYKKVWLTVLEYSLLLNLSAVSAATFYCRDPQLSGNQAVVVYISVGIAFLTFVMILIYHLYQCTINSRAWKTVSDRVTQRSSDRELVNIAGSDEEEEEEPAQAEIRPLMLQFDEYREPVLSYDDQDQT